MPQKPKPYNSFHQADPQHVKARSISQIQQKLLNTNDVSVIRKMAFKRLKHGTQEPPLTLE